MKKIISYALVALMVVAGVSSCKNDKKKEVKAQNAFTGENSYINAIPKGAAAALKLDLGLILDQSDILNNSDFRELLKASGSADVVVNVLQNPGKFGLNIDKPVFLAYDGGAKCTVVASVNAEKLSTIVSLGAMSGTYAVETEGDINYMRLDRDALAAYNNNVFVLLAGDDLDGQIGISAKDYVTNLLKQDCTASAAGFGKFIADESPLSVWGEYEHLLGYVSSMRKYLKGSEREQFDTVMAMMNQYDLTDSYMLWTLSFDNAGINLDFYQYVNDSLMAMSKEHLAKMNPEMLEFLPKDVCLALTVNLKDMAGLLKKSLSSSKDYEDAFATLNQSLESVGLELSDIPENYAFAVGPLTSLNTMPEFVLVCKASQKLYDVLEPFSSQLGNDFVMNYTDGYLTVSSKSLFAFTRNGRFARSMAENAFSGIMTSSVSGAVVLDMTNVALRRVLADADLSRGDEEIALTFLKLVKNATAFNEIDGNMSHGKFTVGVNTHGDNALKTIVDTFLDMIMENFHTPEISYDEFEF